MDTYARSVRVEAPLETVWDFHSTVDGLLALTPEWMHLEIESVHGPEGEPDPGVLEPGSIIVSSVQPFGIGSRQQWTSEIVSRDRGGGSASFQDTMTEGPFESWTHTHLFYSDGDETIIRDEIEYELPFGAVGRAVGPLAYVGFEPMFRHRHEQTKKLLE